MLLCRAFVMIIALFTMVYPQNSLTGTIKKYDGTPVVGIQVVIQDTMNSEIAYTTTDNSGVYTIAVPTSLTHCNIMARINSMMTVSTPGIPKEVYYTAFSKVAITGATTKDVVLPHYYNISGKVIDGSENEISSAQLRAKKWNGWEATPWDNCVSGSNGSYSLFQEAGGIKIWITAPAGYSDFEKEFTIASDTVINLILSKPSTIHGIVKDFYDQAAGNAIVCLQGATQQIDSLSHADGSYNIPVQPGNYKIRLRSNSMNRVTKAPVEFDTTVFESFTVTGDTLVNFSLPRFYRIELLVQDNQSAPVASAQVRSVRGTGIGQLPRDMSQSNGAGICTLYVGSGSNEITVTPASSSQLFELISTFVISSDTAITLTLPKGVKCAGKVLRNDSSVVKGIVVAFQTLSGPTQYEVKTDDNGSYLKNLQPGIYKIRIRNFSCSGNAESAPSIDKLPCELEYTAIDSIELADSLIKNIVLPVFPVMSGVIKNSTGNPVQGVRIYCRGWKNGAEQPPHDESYSAANGAYQLVLGQGINKVWVIPPTSQPLLQSFDFTDNFEADRTRDIIIPDQARGITRIQPSVISTGENGSVMINGINVNFASGSTVNLGPGIEVSNVVAVSNITITADVKVLDSAPTGTHDVIVGTGGVNSIGAGLLTITSPVWAKVELAGGETVKDIRISDGTGTEVFIPSGTAISFPPGSDSTISYSAPLIQGMDTAKPVAGEFTDIQRELHPSGLKVGQGDSIVITSHYSNQDVVGLNEATLTPFYFIDTAKNGSTTAGEAMKLLERDTAKNTISFKMEHFSMFRMATAGNVSSRARIMRPAAITTGLVIRSNALLRNLKVDIRVIAQDHGKAASISLFSMLGKRIAHQTMNLESGIHSISIAKNQQLNGAYILILKMGSVSQNYKVMIIH